MRVAAMRFQRCNLLFDHGFLARRDVVTPKHVLEWADRIGVPACSNREQVPESSRRNRARAR